MRQLKIGGTYRHFKGVQCQVIAQATHTETGEQMVVYMKPTEGNKVWVRPYDMFMSKVDKTKYPDADQEYRFEEVGP